MNFLKGFSSEDSTLSTSNRAAAAAVAAAAVVVVVAAAAVVVVVVASAAGRPRYLPPGEGGSGHAVVHGRRLQRRQVLESVEC